MVNEINRQISLQSTFKVNPADSSKDYLLGYKEGRSVVIQEI
jgi:hypothetical protein